MKVESAIAFASGLFVLAVLLSILANPTATNPLDWLWPPTFYDRVKTLMLKPDYLTRPRTVNPVLGTTMDR